MTMKIEFSAKDAQSFFQAFAELFDAEVVGNAFSLPTHIGVGGGKLFEIEDGLSFFIYDLQLNTAATLKRKGISESKYFPIICWFSYEKIEQITDGEKKLISKDSPYGIFLASPKIDFSYNIPVRTRVIVFTITISPCWLRENITDRSNSKLLKLIESNKPFAIYEEISFNMGQYLEKLQKPELKDMASLILLRSNVLNFLALFISAVENRKNSTTSSSINHLDIQKLFAIRKVLSTEYSSHHEIKTLAADSAMSERKLQKLFKDVFGITIYQYALRVKIEEAKRMIEMKKYSISEVGYNIGYTNLSHFTAAFKKLVGINPKQYLLNLR